MDRENNPQNSQNMNDQPSQSSIPANPFMTQLPMGRGYPLGGLGPHNMAQWGTFPAYPQNWQMFQPHQFMPPQQYHQYSQNLTVDVEQDTKQAFYVCDGCNFRNASKKLWDKHLGTALHAAMLKKQLKPTTTDSPHKTRSTTKRKAQDPATKPLPKLPEMPQANII